MVTVNQDATSSSRSRAGSSTLSVHSGVQRKKAFHSLITPIVQTATYTFSNTQEMIDFMEAEAWGGGAGRQEYSRYGNPTTEAVEHRLAELNHAEASVLFSSGMTAMTTLLLSVLKTGSHVIMTDDCYRRTLQFCQTWLKRLGITTTVVQPGNLGALEAAIIPRKTRFIISESPTNPYLRVTDLERLVEIARQHKVMTVIDSTFATPINQRPLEWGIDFVVHSATKYFSGHNDLMAGVLLGDAARLKTVREGRGLLGGVLDAQSAFLVERGVKTLGVRVRQHNANAQAIAEYLEGHSKIERVWYPGLASHPDHDIASRQMSGYGGVVSFEVVGKLMDAARFVDSLNIPYIAASLGGVESLVEQPAIMSYYDLTTEERLEVGIKDNLVRFAAGIEDTQDLIADIEQALRAV